jgi:hypothetical protein
MLFKSIENIFLCRIPPDMASARLDKGVESISDVEAPTGWILLLLMTR